MGLFTDFTFHPSSTILWSMTRVKAPKAPPIFLNKCYSFIIRKPDELITLLKGVQPSTRKTWSTRRSRGAMRNNFWNTRWEWLGSLRRTNRPSTRTKLCNYRVIYSLCLSTNKCYKIVEWRKAIIIPLLMLCDLVRPLVDDPRREDFQHLVNFLWHH